MALLNHEQNPNRRNTIQSPEAIIPIKVGVTSIRREVLNEEGNDDQLKMNLDYLDKVRTKASQRIAKYQQKMAGYYNPRVKLKRFNIGDLVLQNVTSATKYPTQGTRANLGRPQQDHLLFKTRKLPSRIHGREEITSFMEY